MNTAVATTSAPRELAASWTPEQIDLIKSTIAPGATDDELKLFLYQAKRLGLDPLTKQVHAVKRWDGEQKRMVMAIQTSIDGMRVIAQRTGEYAGQAAAQWCDASGNWMDIWVKTTAPAGAMVGVYKTGIERPFVGVARYDSYVQRKKNGEPNKFWATMPDVMLAKCAESLALRKAFPNDLGDLYSDDEMAAADNHEPIDITPQEPENDRYQVDVPALEDGSGTDWPTWANSVVAHIKKADTGEEIDQIYLGNQHAFKACEGGHPESYALVKTTAEKRRSELKTAVQRGIDFHKPLEE